MRSILQDLKSVQKLVDVGKEAGFEYVESVVKPAREVQEATHTHVRKLLGISVVYPQGMPCEEVLDQLEKTPLRLHVKQSPRQARARQKAGPDAEESAELYRGF